MQLDRNKPLSLALGAGGVRGFAHIGVLEALAEQGFSVSEIVGSSAGAIIAAFYAAVGLSLPELREFGLNLTSQHLFAWAREQIRRSEHALGCFRTANFAFYGRC